jgi:leukotriene-A4 hydrolase
MRRLLALAALALSACSISTGGNNATAEADAGPRQVAPILNEPEAQDWHSFARPQIARVTHVALDLALDFEAQRIGGTATLDIQAADGAQEIVLDNKGLEISAVTDANGQALPFEIGAER